MYVTSSFIWTYKWYKKVFLRLLMQCMLSAHRLYLLNNPDQKARVDFLRFCHDVVGGLLTNSPRLTRPISSDDTVSIGCVAVICPPWRSQRLRSGSGQQNHAEYAEPKVSEQQLAGFRRLGGFAPDCPSQPRIHADQECFRLYHTSWTIRHSMDI